MEPRNNERLVIIVMLPARFSGISHSIRLKRCQAFSSAGMLTEEWEICAGLPDFGFLLAMLIKKSQAERWEERKEVFDLDVLLIVYVTQEALGAPLRGDAFTTMPRVKDVVRNYEQLSVPSSTHSTTRRTRSAIPHISRAPRAIIHPLLRATAPGHSVPTGFGNGRKTNPPGAPVPPDSPELPPTTFPFTTPTRNDEPLLLSHLNYSHELSMKDSASSLSTKVETQIPLQLMQDQNSLKREALPDPPIDTENVIDGLLVDDSKDQTIPSEDVFRRDTPILSLPALDKFLARLPGPVFSPIQDITTSSSKKSGSNPRMFIPLQELNKGRSLVDMFYNRKVALPYRNRNSIFSSVRALRGRLCAMN
jgi:hypothetical protein